MRQGTHRGQGQRRSAITAAVSAMLLLNVVSAPLYTLPQKENGVSISWNSSTDAPAEDMWDFRTIPANAGTTHVVTNSTEFQTALTNCVRGDIIQVTAGTVLTGQFTLPSKTGTGWIIIRTSAHASLPAVGSRVGTGDVSNMFTIRSTNMNGVPITAAPSSSHWRIIGAIFANEAAVGNEAQLFDMAPASAGWSTWATAPHDYCLDRCYFKAANAVGNKRGAMPAGYNVAFYGCRFGPTWDYPVTGISPSDAQCIAAWDRLDRLHIENCYLGAAAEHLFFGGADAAQIDGTYDQTWPKNIIVAHCEFKGDGSTTLLRKNYIESKNSAQVLIWACVFKGYRISAGSQQNAIGILANNQGNSAALAPYTRARDITVRSCWFTDTEARAIAFGGNNGTNTTETSHRCEFSYNFGWAYGGSTPSQVVQIGLRENYEIAVHHNTFRGWAHAAITWDSYASQPVGFAFRIHSNAFPTDSTYGFYVSNGAGISPYTPNNYWGTNNGHISHNASFDAINEHMTLQPWGTPDNTGTHAQITTIAGYGFTDEANNVYSLAGGSALLNTGYNNTNKGGNWSTFQTNISGVVTG